ncbi:MAG: TonB-dependent receptor, partial [Rothia sp. (in: high G+C Gram-positive bacteria)]|uniref:TonB-dependent receptor domain-containing protein n=1 Tax=Rothia sp. (in: high G+C Gram-positive bacteria) TaxID=1885016 RepID=UPI0026E112E8
AYVDHYSVSNSGTADKPEFSITRTYRGNPDLTWEKSKTFDVGLEAGLFNNRLSFEVDFYIKNTSDMLATHSLPMSEGTPSAIYTNEQSMRNTGVDVTVNGVFIQTQKVNWSAQLNLTHYKNELTRMQEGRPEEGYQTGNYWRKKGGSLYDWYMVRFAGVDPETGQGLYYKDVEKAVLDADGNPVKDADGNPVTETVMGTTTDAGSATSYQLGKSALPKLFGGLSTTLQAYGFDLTVSTAFSFGGWTYDGSYASLMSGTSGSTFSTDIYKRWQKPGDVTDVPRLMEGEKMTGGVENDRFLTRSDYFSLRNITLGYTLPQHITERIPGLTSVRVYAVGDNLFLGSHRKGLDPRQNISGAVDTNSYSALRTISFGINVNF